MRAIAIHAPAGYGKSTLVSRWIDEAGLNDVSVWLSLSEDESDPRQFLQLLAAALEPWVPHAPAAVDAVMSDRLGRPLSALRRLLVLFEGVTANVSRDVLLVLDDYHRADCPELSDLLAYLLEFGPPSLRLMVLARRRDELQLARLVAHGQVLTLDKNDLRFTAEEVRQYLVARGFSSPSETDVGQLTGRSEGWVTALQLATLSAGDSVSLQDLLSRMTGDRNWVAAFLADEVLARQPPALQRFLLETSILDTFDADLCEAVTNTGSSAAKLAAVAKADLFLIQLDKGRYRYHHLFQAFLQQRLQEGRPVASRRELHRRAATYLAEAGDDHAAVRHLLAAGDEDAAAALLESRMRQSLAYDPVRTLHLLDLLPRRVWEGRPWLMLDRSLLAIITGDLRALQFTSEARDWLVAQDHALESEPDLYGTWLVLQSVAYWISEDYEAADDTALAALSYEPALDGIAAGTLHFLLAHLCHKAGQHTNAETHAQQAMAAYDRADFRLGRVALMRELARWHMLLGDGDEAARRFRVFLDEPQAQRPGILSELALANILAAEDSYWRADLESAYQHRQAALLLSRQLENEAFVYCCHVMERVYSEMEPSAGEPLPPEARPVWQDKDWSYLAMIRNLETRWCLKAGNPQAAWHLVQSREINLDDRPNVYQQRDLLPYLRAAVATDQDPEIIEPFLSAAIDWFGETGGRFMCLQVMALHAWQSLRQGKRQAAAEMVGEAVALAEEIGYPGILTAIPQLGPLLLESGWSLAMPGAAIAPDLTARELQILQQLAADRTYEEISADLSISINTVRTHVRHIYRKLDVSRRGQAVEVAHRMALLPGS